MQRIDELETLAVDRAKRQEANGALVDEQVPSILAATHDLLPSGLTEEQARAIATDEDVTLVLAGAGTGKTAVIIGKIAHLVRNQGVAPESILALAFNRKAAIEIRERLPADLKGAHASTFHSFALRVIAASSVAPTISKMAQDDFAYVRAIEGMIRRMLTEPQLSGAVLNLLSTMTAEYRTPFDFSSPAEYQQADQPDFTTVEVAAAPPATVAPRKPTFLQKERWKAVQKARRKGMSLRAIERELGIHRATVRSYLEAGGPPRRKQRMVPNSPTSDTMAT